MEEKNGQSISERISALEHAGLPPDEMKEVVKEAITEWLDRQFTLVGKWTINGVLAAGLGALLYFILLHSGWKPEH